MTTPEAGGPRPSDHPTPADELAPFTNFDTAPFDRSGRSRPTQTAGDQPTNQSRSLASHHFSTATSVGLQPENLMAFPEPPLLPCALPFLGDFPVNPGQQF